MINTPNERTLVMASATATVGETVVAASATVWAGRATSAEIVNDARSWLSDAVPVARDAVFQALGASGDAKHADGFDDLGGLLSANDLDDGFLPLLARRSADWLLDRGPGPWG